MVEEEGLEEVAGFELRGGGVEGFGLEGIGDGGEWEVEGHLVGGADGFGFGGAGFDDFEVGFEGGIVEGLGVGL